MDARLLAAIVKSDVEKAHELINESYINFNEEELNRVFITPAPCHTISDMAIMISNDNRGDPNHHSHLIVNMLKFVGAKTYAQIEGACGGPAQHGCHKSTRTCQLGRGSRGEPSEVKPLSHRAPEQRVE